jgi:hypothetical protein
LPHPCPSTLPAHTYPTTALLPLPLQASAVLSQRDEFRNVMNLKGLDVMSTRLWFDKKVTCKFPANVICGFEPDCGGTFFPLDQFQDEYMNSPGALRSSCLPYFFCSAVCF